MPFVRIMVHVVWTTKERQKIITKELKPKLLDHIRENAKLKHIFIDVVNCVEDHVHLLVSLGTEQTISKMMQLIKGESSHWINNHNELNVKFEWQDDYFAVSVSESMIGKVRKYILNQEAHHRTNTFDKEYQEFLLKYNFNKSVGKSI